MPGEGPSSRNERGSDWRRAVGDLAPYLGLGSSMAGIVLLSLALGYWADRRFGTEPFLFLGAGVVGVLAACGHLYILAKRPKT